MNPKIFTAVVAVGGCCIGTPLIIWKESSSNPPSQKQIPSKVPASEVRDEVKVTKPLSTAQGSNVGRGNCEIQRMSDVSVDFLINKAKEGEFYIELLCEKDNSDSGSGLWPHMWTGLVPEKLFKDSFTPEVDKKFNLKTKTTPEKVNFHSNIFKTSFEGVRGKQLQNRKGDAVMVFSCSVNSKQNLKIYIIFDI